MSTGSPATTARIALFNYGAVLALLGVSGIALTVGGDPETLGGLKLLLVPLWFLALGTVNAVYRRPLVERRVTVRSLEHTLVHALVFCACLALLWWIPEETLAVLLRVLAVVGAFFVPWRLYELHRQLRERHPPSP